MSAQFEMKKSRNGKHFFTLLAANGEVILTSQMYASRSGARKGIASVRVNAPNKDRFQRREGKKGKRHFVLRAANHRVIATSQVYSSEAAMEKGIRSVHKNGATKKLTLVS